MPGKTILFALACFAGSTAAQSIEDECNLSRTNSNVTYDDCVNYYAYYTNFYDNTENLTWRSYMVDSNGYQLSMIRVTGDSDNNASNATARGPVLLINSIYEDGTSYLQPASYGGYSGSDSYDYSIVQRLFDAGYDVWISNRRGTRYSQGHSTDNLINDDPQSYWSWDMSTVGEQDINAMVY